MYWYVARDIHALKITCIHMNIYNHLEVKARIDTSDRHKKPLRSPSPIFLPQLLGNKKLALLAVEALGVQ